MKIILGAGQTTQEGWLSLQEADLDLTNKDDFEKYTESNSVDAFLSEHVFEHLTLEEGHTAAQNIFNALKPGGYIRIAVPDKNFRNEEYQKTVQVGGPGPKNHPAASHKIVYDYKTLSKVFEKNGFIVHLLEYFDEEGLFHYIHWNPEDGKIGRSYRYDTRNYGDVIGFPSLILDAYKPLIIKPK